MIETKRAQSGKRHRGPGWLMMLCAVLGWSFLQTGLAVRVRAADAGVGRLGLVQVQSMLQDPQFVRSSEVKFGGVVVFVDPGGLVVVQEGKVGLQVQWPSQTVLPSIGHEVELEARIRFKSNALESPIEAISAKNLGTGNLPPPGRPWLIEALNGRYDRQWVEVEGVVMQARVEGTTLSVHLADQQGWGVVTLYNWPDGREWTNGWGSRIRVQGVNLGRGNRSLRVSGPEFLTILQPGQSGLFAGPIVSAASLLQLPEPVADRVRLRAQVLRVDGDAVYLRSDAISLRSSFLQPFLPGTSDPGRRELIPGAIPELLAGDYVELVGSPLRVKPYLTLSFASFRSLGSNSFPREVTASAESVLNGTRAHDVVRIAGRLLSRDQVMVNKTVAETLKLRVDKKTIQAVLESGRGGQWSHLNVDEWVEALGVVIPVPGEPGYVVKVFNATDVRSLGIAPELAQQRLWKIVGVVVVVGSLGLAWIILLRRQVNLRTAQLKQANDALVMQIQEKELADASLARTEGRLQASELRFKTLFQASPALIVLTRFRDGCFIAANAAFLRATGYEEHEVIGRPAAELNIYAVPEQRMEFRELLQKHGVVRDREHLVQAKDGSVRTVLVSGEMMNIDGEPHSLAVGLDISDRKSSEQDTLRALARERELNELKSRFVSMVSHEFRTPLGITMSAVELLRNYFDRLPEAKRVELFEDIHRSTRLMAGLMEQVLVLGRVEAGKLSFRPSSVDLGLLCNRFVDETLSATNRRCPIELRLDPELPVAVADEALLRQIIGNLLSNAIKYSKPGVPVLLGVTKQGREAVISVEDQGIGIPDSELSNLSQAFYRATNVGETPGTGLGLLIVRRCLDLHGGMLQIKSAVGKGSVFTVRIPLFPVETQIYPSVRGAGVV